jgi:predicted nucleic acid-binding Zn ribbon protein
MTESEKPDVAVEFYYRMKAAITGRKDRDTIRRHKIKKNKSKPFDQGRQPKSIASTMDGLIQSFGWENKLSEGELFANWRELVGDKEAENSFPEDLSKGVLTIRCKSTAWATQLRIMSADILVKINAKLPALEIKELRFIGPQAPSFKRGLRSVPGRGPRDTFG